MEEETTNHAVLRLRHAARARSQRPFVARGSRVERCQRCRLPIVHCMCALRPSPTTRTGFCLLMHHVESLRPSNTGWLVADVVADTHAFAWSRTAPDPHLLALLADPRRQPFVVFPTDAVPPERVVNAVTRAADGSTADRTPLFILLDGSWPEARRIFRKSPYLDRFPVLALTVEHPSRYRLRRAADIANLCTAEVAALCLQLAGEGDAALALDGWLDVFIERSMRARGCP